MARVILCVKSTKKRDAGTRRPAGVGYLLSVVGPWVSCIYNLSTQRGNSPGAGPASGPAGRHNLLGIISYFYGSNP